MLDDVAGKTPLPDISPRQTDLEGSHILYDDTALDPAPGQEFFDPAHWQATGAVVAEAPGRGSVCIFQWRDRKYALRHYCRGGLVARLIHDRYWWAGLEKTRAWHEWHLLALLHGQGLPVPRPVAARVQRQGLFYRADLITEYIEDTVPLADRLLRAPLPESSWRRIGAIIKRFHARGIFHSDLNARNILLDSRDEVFLIDFDQGFQGEVDVESQLENLERLQRSLRKFNENHPSFHLGDVAWTWLLGGYRDED